MSSEKSVTFSLKNEGLFLDIGLFSFNIKSSIDPLAESLSILYKDYPDAISNESKSFIDFYVSVEPSSVFNRYYKKNVQFFFDGYAPFSPLPIQHAPAVIEWGLNWCISNHINTHLIIHAAVIEKSGYAIIMPAPPGSGKSTLTASLIQEGWRLLSDELTLIRLDNYQVTPVPRPVSLKNESIELIKQRYPQVSFGPLTTDTSKGTVCHIRPPLESVQSRNIECPIAGIVFPQFIKNAEPELVIQSKAQTLMEVADNSFNYSRLGILGFNALKSIVNDAYCYQFKYSHLDDAIEVFDSL